MKSKNTIEDEIDVIRDAIYVKIKGMTSAEEIAYFRKQSDKIEEELGITYHRVHEQEEDPRLIVNK
jgi:hypothetical protein